MKYFHDDADNDDDDDGHILRTQRQKSKSTFGKISIAIQKSAKGKL